MTVKGAIFEKNAQRRISLTSVGGYVVGMGTPPGAFHLRHEKEKNYTSTHKGTDKIRHTCV